MNDQTKQAPKDTLLCFGTYRLHHAFNRFYQRAFSQTGLTYAKYIILLSLQEKGAQTIKSLSEEIGVEPNTLSPLLKRMSEFGAITRRRSTKDERSVEVSLTEFGLSIVKEARQTIDAGFYELGIDTERMTEVMGFLDELRHRLDDADPPKLPPIDPLQS